MQKDLPAEPQQDPQQPSAILAVGTTDFSQPRPVDHYNSRTGSRSQSIDIHRANIFPSSLRAELTRSAQDGKYLHSGFPRFNLRRTLGLRRSSPKSPSSDERVSRRPVGGGKAYSGGTEEPEQVRLKVYETFTQTSGRSDSPKRLPHNPTNKESHSENYGKVVSSAISAQNENSVPGQVESITRAIGPSSVAMPPDLAAPSGRDQNTPTRPDPKALMHSHQLCTGNHAGLEKRPTAISQQYNREVEKNNRLMDEKNDLNHENWRMYEENKRLREENEAIKSANANGVPAERYEHLANQFKELNRQCGILVKENQQLRLDLKLESEKELMAAFQTLCCELANTCSRYSHGGEVVDMHPEAVHSIEALLQIRDRLSRKYLSSPANRLSLSMACLSQLLVDMVFHDPRVDVTRNQPKDLWANSAMAENMASLEQYMYSPALNIEEYYRWRCMTVRFLSRSRDDSDPYDRVEPVLQHFLKLHVKMFQLSEDGFRGLGSELRSSVMAKAVDLSLCLRKQRSLIVVRTFGALDDYHKPPDDRPCLVTLPELVRLTSPYGEETGEDSVLVPKEMQRLHKKGEARSSSGAERRRKDSSLPFGKKAGKAKSSA